MKKLLSLVLAIMAVMSVVTACGGKSHTCYKCDETTKKAYYDYNADEDRVMCEECAREYWMPLDYRTYRVK